MVEPVGAHLIQDWIRESLLAEFPNAKIHVAPAFHRYDFTIEIGYPYRHMVLRVRDDTLNALGKHPLIRPEVVLEFLRQRGIIEKLSASSVALL